MTNTQSFAQQELDILAVTYGDLGKKIVALLEGETITFSLKEDDE